LKFILIITIYFIILFNGNIEISAQNQFIYERKGEGLGIYGGWNHYNHRAEFRQLPDVQNCCPNFSEAYGNSFKFSLEYYNEVFKRVYFIPSIGFFRIPGKFYSTENKSIIINGNPEIAEIGHERLTDLLLVDFEPQVQVSIFENFHIVTSLSVSYIINTHFDQKEMLIKPESKGTFENGRRTRNEQSGEISGTNHFMFFLKGGFGYELPLSYNGILSIIPQVSYSLSMNSVLKGIDWYVSNLSLGISLYYNRYGDLSTPIEPDD
jgi:hypothetical protein